jgi:predicted dehydrogenase
MTTPPRPLRFGLVGTGHWARITHAPALASTDGIEFAAVWGRNREAAGALAAEYGATAFSDIDAFLSGVDAVAFSVPPDVQSALAERAASAGKHLLLEKPIATTEAAADALARAVRTAASRRSYSSPPAFKPTCGPGWPTSRARTAGPAET